jgi:alkanesulfonate monooxygenase SsuD/methylene tetrahydromethanopterin reductase-like flavin-dependent oxidoreductase (luciferase family)
MLKFGLINFLENPAGKSERQVVEEQKYLSVMAEEYGFDSVWPVEHHFSEYGHCVSAAVMLGALSLATRTVRLGSGVVALPFQNPIRVAEEFALIDLLSDGRLDFGIGRGFQPLEFHGYGIDQSRSREIFEEALAIILQAWTRDRVDFVGRHFRFEDVTVRPKPIQKPHPPIWMAAVSPESFTYAGERGFNLVCAPLLSAARGLADCIHAYRTALARAGHDPNGKQVAVMLMVHAAATAEQAEADFAEPAVWSYRALAGSAAPADGLPPISSYENYAVLRDRASRVSWSDLRSGDAIVWGTPEHCIERISALRERLGFTTLLCWMRVGSLDQRKVLASMALMQDYVIPHFRHQQNDRPPAGG